MKTDKKYIIGIDLGTTNCAVSYTDLEALNSDASKNKAPKINIFKIPQLTGPGEIKGEHVLPSFLYIPGEYDIADEAISVHLDRDDRNFVGIFARDHGSKVPARLVSSAKSWLCHSGADRRAKILPWGSDMGGGGEVAKVSPVAATASYLKHIKNAWNSFRGDNEEHYLENQVIIITVPASFDEVARDLTIEAATMAGLSDVILIEEPLAAFYSWLIKHEKNWNDFVKPGQLILVCDVGGGTTDFTLITLRETDGSPRFERIAVGDHLILGGDNVDLALARGVEAKLGKAGNLSGDKWKTICHQCRQIKEVILDGKAESRRITITGKGSKLIAGTMSAEIKRQDIEQTVLDGFFPIVDRMPEEVKHQRKGITEFGLPYEQEPAITKHLGRFLERHSADIEKSLEKSAEESMDSPVIIDCMPDLVLFNGGSLKPKIIQDRVRAALRNWFGKDDESLPGVLENPDPDLAVAQGASYYGLVKIGKGVRVGSGSPRYYYLGVSRDDKSQSQEAVCIVERGLEEGSQIEFSGKTFDVLTNQPVTFDLYSSSYRSGDNAGDIVKVDDTMTRMAPIQTVIQFGRQGEKNSIPVTIEAEYTEMGTLSLWCKSKKSQHRWQLRFQLRDIAAQDVVADMEVFDDSSIEAVKIKIKEVFSGKPDAQSPEKLVKSITSIVGRQKEKWPLTFIRAISDELLLLQDAGCSSPVIESRWLNLLGFCMRPGIGDGFDEIRMKQIWKLFMKGPTHEANAQVKNEWWIFWRRVAGGLNPGQQRQFIQGLSSVLSNKKSIKIPPQQMLEIWMTTANMERLYIKDKISLGKRLVSELKPKKSKPQHFWALSRIGARALLYGPVDRVVPPEVVGIWMEKLISTAWKNNRPPAAALAQLGRKTGDRFRDIDETLVERTLEWMNEKSNDDPGLKNYMKNQARFLKNIVEIEEKEKTVIFGESLPTGIVLSSIE